MNQIPKIIHYVWVGPNDISPLAQACIASWKTYLPDYELKLWNESNSPMDHQYVKAMYAKQKWAFVSDYIRFWVLEREGGIYLDTDMEALKPLDDFLDQAGFVGRSKQGDIESSIIGAAPNAPFITRARQFYDNDTLHNTINTSPRVLTTAIAQDETVQIYESSYFHPVSEGESLTTAQRESAYAAHHWAESWVPFARTRKLIRRTGLHKVKRAISLWLK